MFARAALLRVAVVAALVDLVAAFVSFTSFAVTLGRLAVLVVFLERLGFLGIFVPSVELANHTRVQREVKPNFLGIKKLLAVYHTGVCNVARAETSWTRLAVRPCFRVRLLLRNWVACPKGR